MEETAEVLGLAPITVMREWNKAKAWLYRELSKTVTSGNQWRVTSDEWRAKADNQGALAIWSAGACSRFA